MIDRITKMYPVAILLVMMLASLTIPVDTYSQDTGPDNYCIPSNDYMPANVNMGYPANFWCYPEYLKSASTYYDYYFTTPIKEVSITEVGSGEVKLLRQSYGDGGKGMGPWEGCYVYTGARGEMSPGEKYNIRMQVEINYYGYSGTNYCMYNYSNNYTARIFIDYNLDGVFDHLTEWINQPNKIATGQTVPIGATTPTNWWYNAVANCTDRTIEFQITVPDEQPTGVGRMRVMHAYYYPSTYTQTAAQTPAQAGNACWNGYAYDYTAYYGGWYGYNYGEIEDYLIEFSLPFKGSFPDSKAPDDILLAGEIYDGTTRMLGGTPTYFERPFVLFGNPMPTGSVLTYKVVGPLPNVENVIYEGRTSGGSPYMPVGQDVLGGQLRYDIPNAAGPAVVNGHGFRWYNGGEYQLVLGLGKDINNMKYQKKNFTVSWEWDMAAAEITEPISSGPPRFFKYPRGISMNLRGVVQNVGLRGVAKFDAHYDVYNSQGNLVFRKTINWDTANFGQYVVVAKQKVNLDFGSWVSTETDTYKAYITVELLSADDMEEFNNVFRRSTDPVYEFAVKDEIEASARAINVPAESTEFIAGRPFFPMGTLSNEGVGDITNAPTRFIIREIPSLTVIYNELVNVEDVPQGRYNLKQVLFPQTSILKPGNYMAELIVEHPDDLEEFNNRITVNFTVTSGLIGKYTIGTKYDGNARN
ncbi:MAG: GEVED domain-containing protein, partial [Candidatus Kapaibacterium sp.]